MTKLALEQRRERLQEALAAQMVPGMTIEAQTDLSASIRFRSGERRVLTVDEDGTLSHHDYAKESTAAAVAGRPVGLAWKLVLMVIGLLLMGYLYNYAKVERETRDAGASIDNPWFTMRSRDDAIEITLRIGPDVLTDARVTINDRWEHSLGIIRRNQAVVVEKRLCVGDDGLPMPNIAQAVEVLLESRPEGYFHTQRFVR